MPGGVTTSRPKCVAPRLIRSGSRRSSGVIAPQEEWIAVARISAIVSQEQFEQAREKLAHNPLAEYQRRRGELEQSRQALEEQ